MNILEIDKIVKRRENFTLDQISLTLPAGYILGYVGQNGAGKSTTIKMIMGLLTKDAGTIRVAGKTIEEDPALFKEQIGYIADDSYIPDEFTVKKVGQLMKDFYATFNEIEFYNRVHEWDLPLDKKIKEFSKGMKVRLIFACILSRETRLLILDEAMGGLDPVIRSEILEQLQEYIQDGDRSVLFSTHIMSDLEQIADYIFFLEKGKKVFFDTKDALLERYVIVKGGIDDLTEKLKKNLIGARISSIGFEGLLDTDYLDLALGKCVIERPGIEQIIINYIQGVKER